MRNIGPFGNGHSDYDELERDGDTYISHDLDGHEPISKSFDLPDDDDEGFGEGVPSFRHNPYCPIDVLDALEFCGRLAYQIAVGESVTPAQAERAAGRAVKCFAKYDYEQQEWFTEAWPFVKEPEPYDTRADHDELDELSADAAPDDDRGRGTTT